MAVFSTSTTLSSSRVLKDGEDVYVAAGVTVGSDDSTVITSDGRQTSSSGHRVIVAGNVIGQESGIELGLSFSDADQIVTIRAGAEIIGFDKWGVVVTGGHSSVSNAGSIYGGEYGLNAYIGKGESSITNSGTITGGDAGVFIANGGDKLFHFTNTGVIEGGNSSLLINTNGGDVKVAHKVTNTGMMIGDIRLGDGSDTYDGRNGGHVKGVVEGFGGNDKLYGGTENNTFIGDNGNDKLFGGAGNDTFEFTYFLNGKTNVDTITDFANVKGDDDRIKLSQYVFGSLGPTVTTSEFITVTSGHSAKQTDDYLIYNSKDGTLWYDADGSSKDADAIQIATLTNKAALTYHDFVIG